MILTNGKSYQAVFVFLLLLTMPFILFFTATNHFAHLFPISFIWGIIPYSSYKLTMLIKNDDKLPLQLFFWIYVYIFLGLAPFLQIVSGNYPWGGRYTTYDINLAYFIILVGLISYDIGLFINSKFKYRVLVKRCISSKKFLVFSFLGILMAVVLITKIGIIKFFMPRYIFTTSIMEEFGSAEWHMLKSILRIPAFITSLVIFHKIIKNDVKIFSPRWLFYLFLFLITLSLTIIVSNPISAARYWSGTVFFAFYLIWKWNKYSNFKILLITLFAFLFLFPFLDFFRLSTTNQIESEIFSLHTVKDNFTDNGDFDSFVQIMNTTQYVDNNSITGGRQFLGSLLFWVPRKIWTSKPIPSGEFVASGKYDYTNLSEPLWAEAYLDWSFPGLILIFLFYGYFTGLIEQRIQRKNDSILLYFSAIFAPYQLFLLRGALMPAFAYFFPIVLVFLFISKRRKVVH